jgi:hypothetical protein
VAAVPIASQTRIKKKKECSSGRMFKIDFFLRGVSNKETEVIAAEVTMPFHMQISSLHLN